MLKFGLITAIFQTFIYCMLLTIAWYLLGLFDKQYEYGPVAGFAIIADVLLFLLIVTLQNGISTIVNKKWLTGSLFIVSIGLISWAEFYCLIDRSKEHSLRLILLLFAGFTALIIKFPIDTFLKNIQTYKAKYL